MMVMAAWIRCSTITTGARNKPGYSRSRGHLPAGPNKGVTGMIGRAFGGQFGSSEFIRINYSRKGLTALGDRLYFRLSYEQDKPHCSW